MRVAPPDSTTTTIHSKAISSEEPLAHIDHRLLLQPCGLCSPDGKDVGYQFVNGAFDSPPNPPTTDSGKPRKSTSEDVEQPPTSIRAGGGLRVGFEEAIELCGYGRFHYILLAICGLVSTSEEMDVISMSFILPSAQCDLNLDTASKGWLNSIIFIGMMVGAYVWGSISDALGRRKVLIAISFMNGLCIVASSFSQTYELFMFFRFLNGVA